MFREGYLQDQDGNLVFITPTVNAQPGFNGSLFDFQAILPTQKGAPVSYFAGADLSCATGAAANSTAQNFTVGYANISIIRYATFNSTINQTTIHINITNVGTILSGPVMVTEEIPTEVAASPSDITFSLQPTRFENGSVIAIWEFPSGFDVNQTLSIMYTVQKEVTNFTGFVTTVSALILPAPQPTAWVPPHVTPAITPQIPPIILPPTPPSLTNIRVTGFSPFRQVLPGDNIVVNQLLENPTDSPVSFDMTLTGPQGISGEATNIVLAAGEKRTIPMSVSIPSDAKPGYYSFSINLASGKEEVSFPSVMQVVSPPVSDEPSVQRQFTLDYNTNSTTVALTVVNQKNEEIPLLQLSETIPLTSLRRS